MSKLETRIFNISFPNPFILAASPATAKGSMVIEAFKAGWGGAVLKTIGLVPTPHTNPRIHVIRSGKNRRGMLDIELISDMPIDRWIDEISMIRDVFPDRPLFASIMGGGDPYEWQEVVRRLEPHGVNGFEMNASCPNYAEERGGKLGQDAESLKSAVQWVREATKLPVIVKLTPNVTDIVALAQIAVEAGADALTACNSLSGLGGIDIENFTPLPAVKGRGIIGGYGGPGLKPVTLRCTANIAQTMSIPIFGCGGIEKWHDAAEYLAVGASATQICTAVMWHGIQIIDKLAKGLEIYLERKGFSSPDDIKGKALASIGVWNDLDLSWRLVSTIDEERCNGCGICVNACDSGGYQAIKMENKMACIDFSRCDGCGLCIGVCPQEAMSMRSRE
ncbi:NAD-dependent dihydropyrimidine dehydrogenase subunit PreA [Thermoproteota archaeon]